VIPRLRLPSEIVEGTKHTGHGNRYRSGGEEYHVALVDEAGGSLVRRNVFRKSQRFGWRGFLLEPLIVAT